jgi:hypothetical protein
MNLIANVNEDRGEELVRGASGALIIFAQGSTVIGGVALKLDRVTDFNPRRFNVGTLPKRHTVEHASQSRIGGSGIGNETRAAVGPGENRRWAGDFEEYTILSGR